MSVPVFTLSLGCRVLPGCVTVAKFDGSHCCLAAATIADKVVIHSPHHHNGLLGRVGFGSTQSTQELSTLNMSQSVTALCAGVLDPSTDKDMLVVGTATSLLAYNVDTNMELFYRELERSSSKDPARKIPLADNTVRKQVFDMAQDIQEQLTKIWKLSKLALQVDEATDL
uniref:Ciliary BBSome complex subunit 2 N-terminal domain-containing protein n=1 Tax=Timema tahoe TaxID=61484 RepID=A0A7R9P0T6_9NEOP|nr:unnamed protein product [Timema tahoe]